MIENFLIKGEVFKSVDKEPCLYTFGDKGFSFTIRKPDINVERLIIRVYHKFLGPDYILCMAYCQKGDEFYKRAVALLRDLEELAFADQIRVVTDRKKLLARDYLEGFIKMCVLNLIESPNGVFRLIDSLISVSKQAGTLEKAQEIKNVLGL
jgi:hypothetical protein